MQLVQYLISTLYMGVKPSILNANRIGKRRDPGLGVQLRLLKLTLAGLVSEQHKALLLQNCTKLRNTTLKTF